MADHFRDDMTDQVAAATVRLACRYSNGITMNMVARGMTMDKGVLRVLTHESLEMGILLTVMAAFLPSAQPAQVVQVKRAAQPGSFVIDLKLKPGQAEPAAPPVVAPKAATGPTLQQSAALLARRLEGESRQPFYNAAFERSSMGERAGFLAATEIAVFSLLVEQGLVEPDLLQRWSEKQR